VIHEITSAGSLIFSMLIELDPAGHHDTAGEDHHQGNIQQQIALFDRFFMHVTAHLSAVGESSFRKRQSKGTTLSLFLSAAPWIS
jgi:hypothetical protein